MGSEMCIRDRYNRITYQGEIMNQELRNFVLTVLDDDSGISEASWQALHDLLHGQGEMEFIGEIMAQIDACDGRYFIK